MAKRRKPWTIVDEHGVDQYPHGGHDDPDVLRDWVAQHEMLHPEEKGKAKVVRKERAATVIKHLGCLAYLLPGLVLVAAILAVTAMMVGAIAGALGGIG